RASCKDVRETKLYRSEVHEGNEAGVEATKDETPQGPRTRPASVNHGGANVSDGEGDRVGAVETPPAVRDDVRRVHHRAEDEQDLERDGDGVADVAHEDGEGCAYRRQRDEEEPQAEEDRDQRHHRQMEAGPGDDDENDEDGRAD